MKKEYRIVSKYCYGLQIKYFPQYKSRLGCWNNFYQDRGDFQTKILYDKLCEAYSFLDKLKIAEEYGTKIHPYPPEVKND